MRWSGICQGPQGTTVRLRLGEDGEDRVGIASLRQPWELVLWVPVAQTGPVSWDAGRSRQNATI